MGFCARISQVTLSSIIPQKYRSFISVWPV